MPRSSKDGSSIVSAVRLARILGRSRHWASAKFKEWLAEQTNGGAVRVWPSIGKKRTTYFTTMTVVQREFVGAMRDPLITRQLKEHTDAIEFLTKNVNRLLDSNRVLAVEIKTLTHRLNMLRMS